MVNPCNIIADKGKEKIDEKYDPSNFFIKGYKQDKWYKNYEENSNSQPEKTAAERVKLRRQKADNEDLSDMSLLGDEAVKEGKWLKILTQNKLLTMLPILLAKVNIGNSSKKLKDEIRQFTFTLSTQ